jgi:hypothetical protein
VVGTDDLGRDGRFRAWCCTSKAVNIDGFKTNGNWIGLSYWTTGPVKFITLSWSNSDRREPFMAAFRHVVQTKSWFCSLNSDRTSHFLQTPKAGEPVDTRQLTEVGRALKDVGIEPIPGLFASGASAPRTKLWNLARPITKSEFGNQGSVDPRRTIRLFPWETISPCDSRRLRGKQR